jgi:hypothetical protein
MTNEQKKQLHAALMENAGIQLEPGSFEWRIFDESASEDIAKIEPLIDDFVQQAENRGRLAVYLEVAHDLYPRGFSSAAIEGQRATTNLIQAVLDSEDQP